MATRAQKLRLGIFLIVSGVFFAVTVAVLVGASLLEERDEYVLRIEGSIGGLEKGAQVRYNGIRVGRVEDLRINPDDPAEVEIILSLDGGTPVTKDTVAVLNMQGITGLKYIELTGGTADSEVLEPGSEIPSGGSDIDQLTEQAFTIATKIEQLLDNLVAATGGQNVDKVTAVLAETEATLRSVRKLVEESNVKVDGVVERVNRVLDQLTLVLEDSRGVLASVQTTTDKVSQWIDPRQLASMLDTLDATLKEIRARVGPDELGTTIKNANTLTKETTKLVVDADVTLIRVRDDLRRALDDLATSTENISEFTQILVDNPSALISGRSERDRALP